jgi:hypothetical protein
MSADYCFFHSEINKRLDFAECLETVLSFLGQTAKFIRTGLLGFSIGSGFGGSHFEVRDSAKSDLLFVTNGHAKVKVFRFSTAQFFAFEMSSLPFQNHGADFC